MLVRRAQYTDGGAITLPIIFIDLLINGSDHYTRRFVCVSAFYALGYIQHLFKEICILRSRIHFYLNMEFTDICPDTVYFDILNVAYVLTVNA